LEESLVEIFPGSRIVRVDRDSIRKKGVLEETLSAVDRGEADIVVGTQMLAKGHDFKGVTLVAIIDTDSRLYSLDFRSEERLGQLLVQVAGRAGRSSEPGIVLVQTHHPEHPLLSSMLREGYDVFVRRLLDERRAAGLPPFRSMAILRAEAGAPLAPDRFLKRARALLQQKHIADLEISGPVAATMERKAGKYRAQLLLSACRRGVLARALSWLVGELEDMPQASAVRWTVDVDPQDTI
jgi:primosomal protein N' (replication factor Y)